MNTKQNPNVRCPICGKKIKQCPGHRRKPKKAVVASATMLIFLVAASLAIISFQTPSGQSIEQSVALPSVPAAQSAASSYQAILSKVTPRKVSVAYTPVFIFCDDVFWASGVLFKTAKGLRILTTAHNFAEGKSGYYSYQVIRPYEKDRHPINRLEVPEGEYTYHDGVDVISCVPGESQLIEGLKGFKLGGSTARFFTAAVAKPPPPYSDMTFTSLLTGETAACAGITADDGPAHLVLPCRTMAGESGSGYLCSDGGLVIISGNAPLSADESRFLGIEGASHTSIGTYVSMTYDPAL